MRGLARFTFLITCGVLVASAAGPPRDTSDPAGVRALLQQIGGFTDEDWTTVERGGSVARVLDTDTREIAVAGVVRIAAPSNRLIDRMREIENLERSAIVLNAGRFASPPRTDDLASLPLEEYSLDLRECHPGDCRVRLGARDIARFHREVDWQRPDWRERAGAIWRELLAGYASAYFRDGAAALPTYANKTEPLRVAAELEILGAKFPFVRRYAPQFHDYIQQFARVRPAGSDHLLYWTKEDFGVRPVLRVSHQVVSATAGTVPAVVVATNQVYADHYLDAALGVTIAIDAARDRRGHSFYMVAVNRARTRSLSGFLRRMVRGTVEGRSRDAMRRILTATKTALESRSDP